MAPATGEHAAELGVDEGEQHGDGATDAPGEDGGRAGELRGVERGEQPTRADDPGDAREQQRDGADLALEPPACLVSLGHAAPRLARIGKRASLPGYT
jgi:hypothetical protein